MFFASDNWAGAHPLIAESLLRSSGRYEIPYGEGEIDRRVERRLSELFERDVRVFLVGTGTAANALSLASQAKPASVIFCHPRAHVMHEGGGVELMTNGGKLVPVRTAGPGASKIDPAALETAVAPFLALDPSMGNMVAVTLSQATEAGTVYTVGEIAELCAIAHASGLKVHMDGARFSNAVAALGVTPAEMTWKAGIDILSLGGTKNGCWCAEAVVFFDPDDARAVPVLRKRAGHLFSKSSFISAQFDRWLADDLWLSLARHANQMGETLAAAVRASSSLRLAWETGSNQLFVVMSDEKAAALRAAGATFHDWPAPDDFRELGPDEKIRRLIACFATTAEDVDRLASYF
ncbi:MAG: low specificity L-threonine aldolase [Rhizobiaceae bacterium]|nr:low specificity L-threonine aldolase [Rhizobiaceae bacterium]